MGFYGIMTWAGMPEPSNIFYTGTGNIAGNEFRINVERRSSNIAVHGLDLPRGTLVIWHIVDNETFIDEVKVREEGLAMRNNPPKKFSFRN